MSCFKNIDFCINDYLSLSWLKGSTPEERQEQFVVFVIKNSKYIFDDIVRIVSSADYFYDVELDNSIQELISKLENDPLDKIDSDEIIAEDYYGINQTYINWLLNFRMFYIKVTNHLNDPTSEWSINMYKQTNKKCALVPTVNNYTTIISKIIKLFSIDFFLSNDPNQIQTLIEIKDSLQNPTHPLMFNPIKLKLVLIEKCDFLIYKIERSNSKRYKYAINGIEYNEHKRRAGEYKYFNLYDINYSDKETLDQCNSKLSLKIGDEWSFNDYYVRTRSLKETTNSIDNKDSFLKRFESKFDTTNIFDKWAKNLSYNYIYNNILSSELSDSKKNIVDIHKLYRDVLNTQVERSVKNYFPFLKFSQWINKQINIKLKTLSLSDLKLYLSLLEKSNNHLFDYYEWSKSHLRRSFQPSLKECVLEVEDVKIFTATAYIIPIDYSNVEKQIQKVKEDSAISRGYLNTFKLNDRIIEDSIRSADNKIEELRVENRELLKKNVEVLSIFAAIVLFVVGNIQLFKELSTLKSALMFVLTFGYVISIFVLLIRLTTRNYPNINEKTPWKELFKLNIFESIHLVIMAIATIILFFTLFFIDEINLEHKGKTGEKENKVQVEIEGTGKSSIHYNNSASN